METSKKIDRIANTTQEMFEAQRQGYKALTDSFVNFQKRNIRFMQSGMDLAQQEQKNQSSSNSRMDSSQMMALQQRSMKAFQNWMESGTQYLRQQAEDNQQTAEVLINSSRQQQEALRKLGEDWSDVYQEMVSSSASYAEEGIRESQKAAQQGMQQAQEVVGEAVDQGEKLARQAARQAEQQVERQANAAATTNGRGEFPIENYDNKSVSDVTQRLDKLSDAELKQVRTYEKQNKNRETLLQQIDGKIKS